MGPGTTVYFASNSSKGGSTAWASVVAILFAVVAVVSFAVDQAVVLSNVPVPPARTAGR